VRPKDVLAYRRVLLADSAIRRPDLSIGPTDADHVADGIRAALTTADAYYVTEDMTAVARAAGRTMPNQPLMLSDLPSTDGFMMFGAPPAHWVDGDGERVPVAGVVWSTEHFRDQYIWDYDDDGVLLGVPPIMSAEEWAANPDSIDTDGSLIEEVPTRCESGSEIVIYPLMTYKNHLVPLGMSLWAIGDEPDPVRVGDTGHDEWDWHGGIADDDCGIGRPLLATWVLMGQALSVSVPTKTSPTDQKRDARLALPTDLVTVRLRRLSTTTDDDEGEHTGPDYSHQWLVGGHWRNQWLPSQNAHRLQWISPYVKGPAGKPLVVKERITVWSR
jgi:hypothetical protein